MDILEIEKEVALPTDTQTLLQRVSQACLQAEGVTLPVSAHLLVTDDMHIQTFNRTYRKIDRATDVLSFPEISYAANKTAGQSEKKLLKEMDPDTGTCFLGDMVISLPRAKAQSAEYGHSLTRELAYLVAHSMFHLMGYDHLEQQDKRRMRAMEEKALESIGIGRTTDAELRQLAISAMQYSYSPYSHYKVGACLLCKDGNTYTGCNIENSSYGLTNCAERTALFKAVSEGEREFVAIAVAGKGEAPWPCGACRQALNEFAPHLRVLITWDGHEDEAALDELLPHGFGPGGSGTAFLGKEQQ